MKKVFLLKFLYFMLPILIVAYPADLALSYFLKKSHQYPGEIEVWNDIYSSSIDCNVAIYGSSRAWVQLDSKILSDTLNANVYNFGMDGHNFWLQYLRHIEFLKYNPTPKNILYSVDMFTLEKRVDLYAIEQFLPYTLWNKTMENYTKSFIGFDFADYRIPLIRYFGKQDCLNFILRELAQKNHSTTYRKNGYRGMDKQWNDDLRKAKEKTKKYEVKVDQKTLILFESFIKFCKSKGINLIFIYSPEYKEGQNFVSNRNQIMDIYKHFASVYNLPFIDYSDSPLSLEKSLFYNASHLNRTGSEYFTAQLAVDLRQKKLVK